MAFANASKVFMTRRDVLACAHEPFGDAFYYGPERLSERFEDDEETRIKSGSAETTYKTVLDKLEEEVGEEGKRLFIKDMGYYLMPPDGKPARPAPSLSNDPKLTQGSEKPGTNGTNGTNGTHVANGTNGTKEASCSANPTVMPTALLRRFHFTFLIRHPRRSIPSYYRCTIPPLDEVTGFKDFMPSEAGYDELRRLFDFLRVEGMVGPARAGEDSPNGVRGSQGCSITVIDADDLLDQPAKVIEAYCREVGLEYEPEMLSWKDEANQQHAIETFAKWNGFHNDVLDSTSLRARTHAQKTTTPEQENEEWRTKYGHEAQKVIRRCVDENISDYEYLKSFAVKV